MSVIYDIGNLFVATWVKFHVNVNSWTDGQEILNEQELFIVDLYPTMVVVYLMMELIVHIVFELCKVLPTIKALLN